MLYFPTEGFLLISCSLREALVKLNIIHNESNLHCILLLNFSLIGFIMAGAI